MHKLPPVFIGNPVFERPGYNQNHPLSISRVGPVLNICRILNWTNRANYLENKAAPRETLINFHETTYINALISASESQAVSKDMRETFHLGTMENPIFPGLFERVAISVGGSILAAQNALEGRIAYHPAGGTHHGRPNRASGFCYSNDPVFAILELLNHGLQRIAYIDLDAHHGDGVEDAFVDDERVLTISIHEANRWPGTGMAHQKNARNFPLSKGSGDDELNSIFKTQILPELNHFVPEALVVTCGADVLKGDPLSSLTMSNLALWRIITKLAHMTPHAVILGGGGYNPWTTIRYWTGLWGHLNGFPIPSKLPDAATAILRSCTCDLVDDDDINPLWFTTLIDHSEPQNAGGSNNELT